jgi:hypothetical protein
MPSPGPHDVPADFRRALESVRRARLRPEISLDETPGPARLAAYTAAFLADAVVSGEELATGRLVVLHEPAGHDAWHGAFRLVTYVRAALEPEMAVDPLLPSVGWAWLLEALDAHGARFAAPSGTVTRVASESFGTIADDPHSGEIEVRASWSPIGLDLASHVAGWADLLCHTAGLPPVPDGVAALPTRALARRSARPARP